MTRTLASAALLHQVFDFSDYTQVLGLVRNSLVAGAVLAVVCGLVSVFVMHRDLPFAVHGVSELSFAGAAAALLAGVNVVVGSLAGSLLAAVTIGALGMKARDRNSVIGVLMPFGLGVGVLCLALYPGRGASKFGLLTGQIVSIDTPRLSWLIGISIVVLLLLAVLWRPLVFAGLDPEVAAARGVPVRLLAPAFMLVLGMTVAMSVQIVGSLLVLSVLCTPAAAALRVTSTVWLSAVLSVTFALVAVVGGILLAVGSSVPISPYITSVSFLIYLACRVLGGRRDGTPRATVVTVIKSSAS